MKNDTLQKSNNREKKEKTVAEFTDRVNRAHTIVFTNYQGMTHRQLEQVKRAVGKMGAEFVITKNRLLKLALANKNLDTGEQLEQPTATLFAYDDPITPLKELTKFMKTANLPTIKFGVVEGKIVNEADVVRFSTLPGKEVLLAQLVGTMKSPIYGLHRALSWNLQKFVMTLKAVEATKTI